MRVLHSVTSSESLSAQGTNEISVIMLCFKLVSMLLNVRNSLVLSSRWHHADAKAGAKRSKIEARKMDCMIVNMRDY